MAYPKNHNYGSKGYKKEDTSEVIAQHHGKGAKSKTVRIHEDGTLEAEAFSDRSSDGLVFDELQNQMGFGFHKPLDENTEIHYVPNSVRKYYSTTAEVSHSIKDVFAQFRGELKKLVVKDLLRYKKSKKSLKNTIDKISKKKLDFIFTKQTSSDLFYSIPYSQSWCVGPYNYPTVLKVTKDIDNLNDILIIKTGTFMSHWSNKNQKSLLTPAGEQAVYISPHEIYGVSGLVYTHLGSGKVTNDAIITTFTSNHVIIPEGEILGSGTQYRDIRTNDLALQTNTINQSHSQYANQYIKNVFTGLWDGVIPSGAYARIETASTDGKYIGFDGEISVVQYTGEGATYSNKIDIDCSGIFTGVGVDATYEYSVDKAIASAKRKYYKKLNLLLVSLGVKNKSSRMKRYEKMLDRVAQNVYDGYGIARNEKVGAAQGTESSPVGSPMYYDGMLNMYGGTRDSSNYNYTDIWLDKISNPVAHILYPSSGIYKGSLSNKTNTSTSNNVGGGSAY